MSNVYALHAALAGGTLLYVSVFEVLARERLRTRVSGLLQLGVCVLGYSCIMTIDLLGEERKQKLLLISRV